MSSHGRSKAWSDDEDDMDVMKETCRKSAFEFKKLRQ